MAELKNCTTNFYPELCGVNVIVDPQQRLGTDDDRILIIGQRNAAGSAPFDAVQQVREDNRTALFGANSMLNRMIDEVRLRAPTAELYAYVLPNSGTAGEADVTFTGVSTATAPGRVVLFVNGRPFQVDFDPATDTAITVAAKFAVIINATNPTLTASSDAAGVLTITTDIFGEIGGFLDVRDSYSERPDLAGSTEVTVAIAATAPTGQPNLSGLAALTQGFEFVINPYTDSNSLDDLSQYLCGQWSGGANSRSFGVFYGTDIQAIIRGQQTNNALISMIAVKGALTPPYLESATYGSIAFNRLNCQSTDIAASFTGEIFPAMLAPEIADRFSAAQEAALVEAGMGYFRVLRTNEVAIGRAVTTYTTADNGTLDTSLRDVNSPSMIACISRFLRDNVTARFTGYSFRRDGIVGRVSDRVATIPAIRNYLISLASRLSDRNLVQDIAGFIQSLNVDFNAESGCIEISVEPELVRQFCCANITLRTI